MDFVDIVKLFLHFLEVPLGNSLAGTSEASPGKQWYIAWWSTNGSLVVSAPLWAYLIVIKLLGMGTQVSQTFKYQDGSQNSAINALERKENETNAQHLPQIITYFKVPQSSTIPKEKMLLSFLLAFLWCHHLHACLPRPPRCHPFESQRKPNMYFALDKHPPVDPAGVTNVVSAHEPNLPHIVQ